MKKNCFNFQYIHRHLNSSYFLNDFIYFVLQDLQVLCTWESGLSKSYKQSMLEAFNHSKTKSESGKLTIFSGYSLFLSLH